MLQMAADAAAPAARPSRTAETSTSTLWAPDAPLLRGLGAMDQQHQQTHAHDAAVPQQLERQQPQEMASQAAELPVAVAQSQAALASSSADRSRTAQRPAAAQQEAQQMHHHHDAHQPWASAWPQPILPAVTTAAGHSGQEQSSLGHQQRRRGTAESVAVSASLQQQRRGHGLHAARSLSWSQSAEEQAGKWMIDHTDANFSCDVL